MPLLELASCQSNPVSKLMDFRLWVVSGQDGGGEWIVAHSGIVADVFCWKPQAEAFSQKGFSDCQPRQNAVCVWWGRKIVVVFLSFICATKRSFHISCELLSPRHQYRVVKVFQSWFLVVAEIARQSSPFEESWWDKSETRGVVHIGIDAECQLSMAPASTTLPVFQSPKQQLALKSWRWRCCILPPEPEGSASGHGRGWSPYSALSPHKWGAVVLAVMVGPSRVLHSCPLSPSCLHWPAGNRLRKKRGWFVSGRGDGPSRQGGDRWLWSVSCSCRFAFQN